MNNYKKLFLQNSRWQTCSRLKIWTHNSILNNKKIVVYLYSSHWKKLNHFKCSEEYVHNIIFIRIIYLYTNPNFPRILGKFKSFFWKTLYFKYTKNSPVCRNIHIYNILCLANNDLFKDFRKSYGRDVCFWCLVLHIQEIVVVKYIQFFYFAQAWARWWRFRHSIIEEWKSKTRESVYELFLLFRCFLIIALHLSKLYAIFCLFHFRGFFRFVCLLEVIPFGTC